MGPHNLLFTSRRPLVYVFPKPHQRPSRSFELYPETVGGPELIGSFTVYNENDYAALTPAAADELVRINTAPPLATAAAWRKEWRRRWSCAKCSRCWLPNDCSLLDPRQPLGQFCTWSCCHVRRMITNVWLPNQSYSMSLHNR